MVLGLICSQQYATDYSLCYLSNPFTTIVIIYLIIIILIVIIIITEIANMAAIGMLSDLFPVFRVGARKDGTNDPWR